MSRKQIRINTDKEHSRPPNEPEARLTYKNTEGYADPTCFYALCNVMRDEKRRKQQRAPKPFPPEQPISQPDTGRSPERNASTRRSSTTTNEGKT